MIVPVERVSAYIVERCVVVFNFSCRWFRLHPAEHSGIKERLPDAILSRFFLTNRDTVTTTLT